MKNSVKTSRAGFLGSRPGRGASEPLPRLESVVVSRSARFDSGPSQQPAQSSVSRGSALLTGDGSVAINHNIDGIRIRLVHGREIGVFGKYDPA